MSDLQGLWDRGINVPFWFRIDQLAEMRSETLVRTFLIRAHRVANHGHADRTHNGSRRGNAEFRENHLARRDDLADLDHLILLRISTTALPLSHTVTGPRRSRWIKWI